MSLNEPSFGYSALVPFSARTYLAKVAERYLLVSLFPVKIFGSSLHSGQVFISGSQISLSLLYNVESLCLLLILNLEVRFLPQCMPAAALFICIHASLCCLRVFRPLHPQRLRPANTGVSLRSSSVAVFHTDKLFTEHSIHMLSLT